ncbi:hypothetical protein N9M80_00235 [Flavobacteriales bacterium]|jgi:hypothetical protein|nr:hypothetical protein [Flavobacteriales bacterium]
MQIHRIQQLIANPEQVVPADRQGLEEWCNRYPYAGVFAMLLARCSAVEGHMDEEKDLLRAASAASFRQPLFDLIVQAKLVEEARSVHESLSNGSGDEVKGDEKERMESSADGRNNSGLNPDEPVEREALISAIERTIEHDVTHWDSNAVVEEQAVTVALPEDIQLIQSSVSSPFSNWLLQRASEVGFGDVSETPSTAPESGAASIPEESNEKKSQMDLINRFIAEQPRLGPIRESLESKPWVSDSILEDPSLVTETMARVYAKQGLFEKARKAYHLLSLKYPAKSTYFALQLKKLEDPASGLGTSNE